MDCGVGFRIGQLAKADLFRRFGREFLTDLAEGATYLHVYANTHLIHQGDMPSSIYVIVGGRVRLSLPLYDGRDFIFSDLGPGDVFDLSSLFLAEEHQMNAVSMSESVVLGIEAAYMLKLFERHASVAAKMIPFLCQAVKDARERVIDGTASMLPARLASTVLRIVRNPQGIPVSDVDPVAIQISQTDLAAMVPASREKVNRCLREWQQRGISRYENRWLTILNFEGLRAISQQSHRTTGQSWTPARRLQTGEPGRKLPYTQ